MNLLLKASQIYIPSFVKKRRLHQLFNLTADAFQCQAPRVEGLSLDQCLVKYALFTKGEAEKSIQQGQDLQLIKGRLYQNAYQLGASLRKGLRITTPEEVMTMSKLLYQILGIEFQGDAQGDVIIKRCFFSQFYSSEVCQVISSLDEGVAAGLSAGGQLSFYQRITEGNGCCRAHFVLQENPG